MSSLAPPSTLTDPTVFVTSSSSRGPYPPPCPTHPQLPHRPADTRADHYPTLATSLCSGDMPPSSLPSRCHLSYCFPLLSPPSSPRPLLPVSPPVCSASCVYLHSSTSVTNSSLSVPSCLSVTPPSPAKTFPFPVRPLAPPVLQRHPPMFDPSFFVSSPLHSLQRHSDTTLAPTCQDRASCGSPTRKRQNNHKSTADGGGVELSVEIVWGEEWTCPVCFEVPSIVGISLDTPLPRHSTNEGIRQCSLAESLHCWGSLSYRVDNEKEIQQIEGENVRTRGRGERPTVMSRNRRKDWQDMSVMCLSVEGLHDDEVTTQNEATDCDKLRENRDDSMSFDSEDEGERKDKTRWWSVGYYLDVVCGCHAVCRRCFIKWAAAQIVVNRTLSCPVCRRQSFSSSLLYAAFHGLPPSTLFPVTLCSNPPPPRVTTSLSFSSSFRFPLPPPALPPIHLCLPPSSPPSDASARSSSHSTAEDTPEEHGRHSDTSVDEIWETICDSICQSPHPGGASVGVGTDLAFCERLDPINAVNNHRLVVTLEHKRNVTKESLLSNRRGTTDGCGGMEGARLVGDMPSSGQVGGENGRGGMLWRSYLDILHGNRTVPAVDTTMQVRLFITM
eukprot:GHVQ01025547.1.p1 GENE.GHVQ01025547.1~~GHVQ01025547.1.p1  ORF type:complete len:613 (-),score=127.84 GHVQ01025547.1:1712-3550(-)